MTDKKTIRELIEEYRNEILNPKDLLPARASEILTELSAIFGNLNDELRKTAMEYNKVLAIKLKQTKSVAEAKVLSEITQEWSDWKEAKDKKEELLEMIRSLKYYLRAKEDEWRTSGNL